MSLVIYTNVDDVESSGKELIKFNDMFFDIETNLEDTEFTRKVLDAIDKASYNSPFTFTGRTEGLGTLNKNMLSTGAKTLLNIVAHPQKCFDVCECGDNVLSLLPLIPDGSIYWETPVVVCNDIKCDILCNGKRYTDFYDSLESVGK